jgi:hypothetical protein
METKAPANQDISQYEAGLDANWNERKHLIDREFEFRLKIQELLIKADPAVEQLRAEELVCQDALRRNAEEYAALVEKWSKELFGARA